MPYPLAAASAAAATVGAFTSEAGEPPPSAPSAIVEATSVSSLDFFGASKRASADAGL